MDTKEIRAFALETYRADKNIEDDWVRFNADWAVNIFQPHWDEGVVRCDVYPVVDGVIGAPTLVYSFYFPREPEVKYTEDREKWYALEMTVVTAMAGGIFRSVEEATSFVDDLYDHHLEYVRGLEQDRLIELVKAIDPELLKIVEV